MVELRDNLVRYNLVSESLRTSSQLVSVLSGLDSSQKDASDVAHQGFYGEQDVVSG